MSTVDLSVIIATWNSKDLVIECVRSLYENVKGISFEVILVVNGSVDGTQEAVETLFPQVIMLHNSKNMGFTRANNRGIQRATGRHILLLNDDTIVLAGALEKMVDYLTANPDVGVVGAQLIHMDDSKQNCIHNFPSILTEVVPAFLLQIVFPHVYPSKRRHYEKPIPVPAVLGACMMIRHEAIQKVGLLDEGFFSYLEETDWLLRMGQAGYRTVHIPDARIYHIHGASSKKRFPGASRVEYYRSLYRFFQKHYGTTTYRSLLIIKWVGLVVNVFFLFVLCLLTGFRKKRLRDRFQSYAYLLVWHCRGRPDHMGLSDFKADNE
jgi:GT2 family glycosyltransferase